MKIDIIGQRLNLIGFYKNKKHLIESLWYIALNGYPARQLIVIGVTGTDGKTTTSHLIYEILRKANKKVALVSTLGAYFGNQKIDTGFHVTTPDAKLLQPLIKKAAENQYKYLILETTSHAIDQHRTLGCNFHIGVLTNITHEHLDYHKTFEKYRDTKLKLFRGVKFAVINQSDPSKSYIKSKLKNINIIWYKKKKLTNVPQSLTGDYNQYNIGAALQVARLLGIPQKIATSAIENFKGVEGRMTRIPTKRGFDIIIDFAHTPNSLEKLLKNIKTTYKNNNIILVFGCAGNRDPSKRPIMGKIASKYANRIIITAEDPRNENLDNIYKDITSQISHKNTKLVKKIDDRFKAIEAAITCATNKDVVLITGKGHEKSLAIGSKEIPWSETKAIEKVLRKLTSRGSSI